MSKKTRNFKHKSLINMNKMDQDNSAIFRLDSLSPGAFFSQLNSQQIGLKYVDNRCLSWLEIN